MSFELFAAERNRTSNLIMLGLGVFLCASYAAVDLNVFTTPYAYFAMGVRVLIVTPILLVAWNTVRLRRYAASEITTCSALALLLGVYYVGFSLDQFIKPELSTLFAISSQVLCFLFLTIFISNRAYKFVVIIIALYSIFAITNARHGIAEQALFGVGMAGLFLFLSFGVYSRHRQKQREYALEEETNYQLSHRTSWNKLLRETIDQKANEYLCEIEEDLLQYSSTAQEQRFIQRAIDSTNELKSLTRRIVTSTQWEMFDSNNSGITYSVIDHLRGVLIELSVRYPSVKIIIHPSCDFEVQIEKALLTRLVTNIIDNAVRHHKAGSSIVVSSMSPSSISIFNEGDPLPTDFGRMLEPGTQGSLPGSFGLGLFVCHRICESNAIDWSARNKDSGVEVVFRFPALSKSVETWDSASGLVNEKIEQT